MGEYHRLACAWPGHVIYSNRIKASLDFLDEGACNSEHLMTADLLATFEKIRFYKEEEDEILILFSMGIISCMYGFRAR
jgi:hypothetical protein